MDFAEAEAATILRESAKSAHKRLDDDDRRFDSFEQSINRRLDGIGQGVNRRFDIVEQSISEFHRIAASVDTLALHVKHLAEGLASNKGDMKEQDKRISALEHKPAKRWETVVTQLIGLAVAAVVGALLARLGG